MTPLTIKKATRQGVKPLIDLYSESGCGKTYSSLLLARGFVGPSGKIILVDSESGRGSLYADVLPGGYEVIEIGPPFSPSRYIEAIEAVEKSGAAIGVIDSASHEWEGEGGVCDMAAQIEAKSGKGLHTWNKPKMEHGLFVRRLQRSTIPWVVCLRAKYKTRQLKVNGRTEIVKDECTSPIQAEDFIFEATCHAEILPDHSIRLTKCSHPALRECFPKTGPIEIKHGEAVAKWCNAPTVQKTDDPAKALKSELWTLTKSIHGAKAGMSASELGFVKSKLTQWLIDESVIGDTETLDDYSTVERMTGLIAKVKGKMTVAQGGLV